MKIHYRVEDSLNNAFSLEFREQVGSKFKAIISESSLPDTFKNLDVINVNYLLLRLRPVIRELQ